MFKVASMFRYRAGMEKAEAGRYMTSPHGQVVTRIPGLVKYVQHHVLEALDFDGGGGDDLRFDAYVSHWYRDRDTFEAALRSPEWQAAMDDAAAFVDLASATMGAVEERVLRDGEWGSFKTVAVATFRPDLGKDAAGKYWTETHGPLTLEASGFTGYVQNHGLDPIAPDPRAALRFDGFSEHWFEDGDAFRRASRSPGWQALYNDGANFLDMTRLWGAVVEERVLLG